MYLDFEGWSIVLVQKSVIFPGDQVAFLRVGFERGGNHVAQVDVLETFTLTDFTICKAIKSI